MQEVKQKIKLNINKAKEIVDLLKQIETYKHKLTKHERDFVSKIEVSLLNQLDTLVNSIDMLLIKPTAEKRFVIVETKTLPISLDKKQKEKFLQELNITEQSLERVKKILRKRKPPEERQPTHEQIRKPNPFVTAASRLFGNLALRLANKEMFKSLKLELRKANIPFLASSYIALMFYTSLLVFILGLILSLVFTFFSFSVFEGIKITSFNIARFLRFLAFSIIASALTFVFFFTYPSAQAKSISRRIQSELPFAALYMASIASAGIEPAKIFELMASSKEYKAVSTEIKKIVNQMNVYGIDLISAIKNSVRFISNKKLVELLNGIVLTLTTGGNLQVYFEQKADSLFVDYRLERKKFMQASNTYADIYTGLLITAPLIFMLVLVLINLLGSAIAGLSPASIAMISIGLIIMLNIGFLIFLQITQPPG